MWAVCGLYALVSTAVQARPLLLRDVVIIAPHELDTAQKSAIRMFIEEGRARTGASWELQSGGGLAPLGNANTNDVRIVAAREDQFASLLPADFAGPLPPCAALSQAEGFAIRVMADDHGRRWILVSGHDDRGLLYALGYLLRKSAWSRGVAIWSDPHPVCLAPALPVRGHQLGYRAKSNTYDGWTVAQFEQYLRDLAVFGANTIELLPPVTDDAPDSPLFPQPALDTMVAVSGLIQRYGLRCSVFYPALAADYRDPATVRAELERWEELLAELPQVDELFVPGGDPGHTDPQVLFAFLQQLAPRLHQHHPGATIWVSSQGFDARQTEEFYGLLARPPVWLGGVVFGPQSRDALPTQRARIPSGVPIRLYPDITHTHHAQFPVPHWDPALALTEGREPINPQPRAETLIFEHFAPEMNGFVTYSEGVNDDVNKFVWTALGVDPHATAADTLADYARWFLGSELGEAQARHFAAGLAALERNWEGPLVRNRNIGSTLRLFRAIEARAPGATQHNWRLQLALYRAWFDALQQRRARVEASQERLAMRWLARADRIGSEAALTGAQRALGAPAEVALRAATADQEAAAMRAHLEGLAANLFDTARLQLSVARFGASGVDRGANLDTMDVSVSDRVWLLQQFAAIREITTESQRLARIRAVLDYERPVPGSYYDDLGEPGHEPHLVRHDDPVNDPDLRHTPHDGIADRTPDEGWRRSWVTYAGALYDEPLTLVYEGLSPQARYRVRVTYAGEDFALPIRLVANDDMEIHPPRQRLTNPETVAFDVPHSATAGGRLTLRWLRPAGEGGSGRGCQVAEVWLIPTPGVQGSRSR
jgi:hypothetical protein